MKDKAVCRKVTSMLSLYIDDKVTLQEKSFIEEHLAACDECHQKYLYLKSLIKNLKDSYKQVLELAVKKQKQVTFNIKEHEKFLNRISPYVDNELDSKECFDFRKYLMKSKSAQKELKKLYTLQKKLKNSFNETKKFAPKRITHNVMRKITPEKTFFESTIIEGIFSQKTAKAAILAGLILFGAYEFKQLDTPLKEKTKQVLLKEVHRSIGPANTNTPKTDDDFIKF